MNSDIQKALDLLEEAECAKDLSEKAGSFIEGMEILNSCLNRDEHKAVVEDIIREHIHKLVHLLEKEPLDDIDDIISLMDMITSTGDLLFDVMESDYRGTLAWEKIFFVANAYKSFTEDLSKRLRGR